MNAKMFGLTVAAIFLLWLSSLLHRLTVANFEFDKQQALNYDQTQSASWPRIDFAIK